MSLNPLHHLTYPSLPSACSFLKNTLFPKSLLQNTLHEHLTDIEMRKDKRRTDNDRKRTESKQQGYNDIDWEDLYHRNQLASLRVGELDLYVNHHNIAFKGKKDEKVRVMKAHIGRTVRTTFIYPLTQIQSLSVTVTGTEHVVGSSSSSSERNDSGDQAGARS